LVPPPQRTAYFLRQAQARQGLAGVDDLRPCAGDGIHVLARHRGRAGEQLQEIQRRPLGAEQRPGVGLDLAEHLAGVDARAVAGMPADARLRVELAEAGLEPGGPAEDRLLAADDDAARRMAGRREQRGQVAAADVLGQGGGDVAFDFGLERP
jgi:hypothetical protein